MRKHVLSYVLSFVFLLAMSACSPSDNNGTLTLKEGETVKFTLLQTTDVHHHVVGTGPSATYGTENDATKGGYARLARRIQYIKGEQAAAGSPTVLVDSGDFLMGTVYDLSLGSNPAALAFFKTIGYSAITIGNHELDYGPTPLANFFNLPLVNGLPSVFKVPVVVSNMQTNGHTGINALKTAGVFKESHIITLDNGLKVGLLGFMGANAAADAPVKAPVTFDNDLTDPDVVEAFQAKVDAIREAGAHVVVVLSHSGITDPNSDDPGGDDVELATAVEGIDIIASGHEHQMTADVVTVNGTRIICAGRYGESLAQLNATVKIGTGVIQASYTNNCIGNCDDGDDYFEENQAIKVKLVGGLDTAINASLEASGLPDVNEIVAGTNSSNLAIPNQPGETGIGNLAADSLRYLLAGAGGNPSMSIVANGVIRNGYTLGQQVSFADIYNTLPLGMTLDPANQNIPGYPLVMIYMDNTSILNLCKLAAYTIGAQDGAFMAYLLANSPTMYMALSNLKPDYYLNFSGVRYTYGAGYAVTADNVALYGATDFSCQSAPTIPSISLLGTNRIPCVLDLYTALMFLDADMQSLLTVAGLPIVPYTGVTGSTVLSADNVLNSRLDRDTSTAGVQEVKEWMALLQFVTKPTAQAGLNNMIADSKYGSTALGSGNASRVNP